MFQPGTSILDMLADPIVQAGLAAVIGGIVLRLFLRGHPAHALVLRLGFLIFVTTIAIRSGNAPYDISPADVPPLHRFFFGLTKFVWWTTAAWFTAACVRLFLRFDGQAREVRVIQDLIVGVIYVGAVLSIVAYVFGAPVGTLVATSGVVAIILGLAMQSTLSDLFSGLAINIGRPFAIGDWIALPDGTQGRVVEMNWRATHLLNGTNDLVILPNAQLAKSTVINRSGPDQSHGATLTLRFVPNQRPARIGEALQNALLNSTVILQTPPPVVRATGLDGDAATFELSFRVTDFTQIGKAKSDLLDLVFRHAKAADLKLASSREGQPGSAQSGAGVPSPTPLRLVEAMPLFASLTPAEKEQLAQGLKRRAHRSGDMLASPGEILHALLLVRSGVVSVEEAGGPLLKLAPGDYFGEAGMLTETAETSTYRAVTNVVLYEVSREALWPLVEARPSMAQDLAIHLAERTARLTPSTGSAAQGDARQQGFLTRVVDQLVATLKQAR